MRTVLGAAVILFALAVVVPFQGCGDNDNSIGLPCCPVCGDGVCTGDEMRCNCLSECADDLGCMAFIPTCGNGVCDRLASPGESHERCPEDCPLACRQCEPSHRLAVVGDAM
jgi:hypothetical protein